MLIKAAICEDIHFDQQEAYRHLKLWEAHSGHETHVKTFADTAKLCGAIDEDYDVFDVYLLDIEMTAPREGLDFAQRIRKNHKNTPIIFITSHHELSLEGFDVHALHFLAKPIDTARFFRTLDRLAEILEQRKASYFSCNIDGSLTRIPVYEILYFCTDGHYLLVNGDTARRFRGKLSDVTKNYPDTFTLCHQSYAINIGHARSLVGYTLKLSDGTEIFVSKANLNQVQQQFLKFYTIQS